MSFYRGMTCENVTLKGHNGTPIAAYVAKPAGPGPHPGVVLIHHLPGWSELYIETTRRFAHHGYLSICANFYEREGCRDAGGSGDSQGPERRKLSVMPNAQRHESRKCSHDGEGRCAFERALTDELRASVAPPHERSRRIRKRDHRNGDGAEWQRKEQAEQGEGGSVPG